MWSQRSVNGDVGCLFAAPNNLLPEGNSNQMKGHCTCCYSTEDGDVHNRAVCGVYKLFNSLQL